MCTVDGESLSKITIRNLETSRKIEICYLPYGRQPTGYLVYFHYNGAGDIYNSTLRVFGVGVDSAGFFAPLATAVGKVSAAEVTDQISDQH